MGDLGALIALGTVMAVCTFVTGCLPLVFGLSRVALRRLELWGSGLLIGAALTVVIPEGIASVFGSNGGAGLPSTTDTWVTRTDIIAFCLLSGFMLMFVIDKYSSSHAVSPQLDSDELETLSEVPRTHNEASSTSEIFTVVSNMCGLLIHAAADGVAMGASSRTFEHSLRVVVALAIMVHKAPTSIGLCTLLMARQFSTRAIRMGILIFSIATPLSALVSFFVIRPLLPGSDDDGSHGSSTSRNIGAVLTFSGGTFLFVAMHAVQHLSQPPPAREALLPREHHNNDHHNVSHHAHHPLDYDHPIHTDHAAPCPAIQQDQDVFSTWECVILVCLGTITPKVLQLVFGAGHEHHDVP